MAGKRISWSGWVEDVREKSFGGYELQIDMDSPNKLSVQDIRFDIPESDALHFKKGQKIDFQGDIKSIYDFAGTCQISLENCYYAVKIKLE